VIVESDGLEVAPGGGAVASLRDGVAVEFHLMSEVSLYEFAAQRTHACAAGIFPMRIGIDSGGTFTDFVVLDDTGNLESFKLRSNPASHADVVLDGLRRIAAKRAEVVHGSTVATNALLERKGAKTAFVTTGGFEDLIA